MNPGRSRVAARATHILAAPGESTPDVPPKAKLEPKGLGRTLRQKDWQAGVGWRARHRSSLERGGTRWARRPPKGQAL
jgi:hypothetical protein